MTPALRAIDALIASERARDSELRAAANAARWPESAGPYDLHMIVAGIARLTEARAAIAVAEAGARHVRIQMDPDGTLDDGRQLVVHCYARGKGGRLTVTTEAALLAADVAGRSS